MHHFLLGKMIIPKTAHALLNRSIIDGAAAIFFLATNVAFHFTADTCDKGVEFQCIALGKLLIIGDVIHYSA